MSGKKIPPNTRANTTKWLNLNYKASYAVTRSEHWNLCSSFWGWCIDDQSLRILWQKLY